MTDEAPPTDGVASPSDDGVTTQAERELPTVPAIRAVVEASPRATFSSHEYASSDVVYHVIRVPVEDWVTTVNAAFHHGFDMFVDLAAVDHFAEAPRFEVSVNLLSMTDAERLIISTRVPYDDPTVPTLTDVFAGANFYEREAFDLVGVRFSGHPDLTRILMPDDWEGHPLRKDYNIGAVPVEFKAGSADL